MTKAFNATALALLVDEGKLQWTDAVIKFLPDFQLHDAWITHDVTLVDLLSHRTGLEYPDLLCQCAQCPARNLNRAAPTLAAE